MGTTRIKVIDLSSDEKEIKTSRKHAEKLTGAAKLKAAGPEGTMTRREEKKPKKPATTEITEKRTESAEEKVATAETAEKERESTEKKPVDSVQTSAPSALARKPQSLHHKGHKYLAAKTKIENGKRHPVKEAAVVGRAHLHRRYRLHDCRWRLLRLG